jgi:hypothetical protein
MKTSELTGAALDWAVARCEALGTNLLRVSAGRVFIKDCNTLIPCHFSTDWAQGGPIIEREKITPEWTGENWMAYIKHDDEFFGPTPLIAAMRCYVASKLGDEIDLPKELL